ncbi:hypothetical protein [Streptacidiphilus monticola]|uniref:LysR substrate-binding domain-containing protein n=1 Tax=Streptacidiphilus monticola TaxID=2161674 RepID=A0ABW1G6T7_9ACTN
MFDTSVTDWDTAILLAELGLGVAVVPALPAWTGPSHPDLRLIPIPALPALTGVFRSRAGRRTCASAGQGSPRDG